MQKDIENITKVLDEYFPNAHCELEYNSCYQLLVAVILSAQCTDKRVNIVTKELFKLAPTAKDILKLGEERLKDIIKPCGFYNNKAKSIISATIDIVEKFGGKVPSKRKELESLRGVGRKTANVVLAECFNEPTIAVDTHVLRISKRLKLTSKNSTPETCEKSLLKLVKKDNRIKFHHQMIWFGRNRCKAIKPNCENCKMQPYCTYKKG